MSKQYKKSQNNKAQSGTLRPSKSLGQNFLVDENVISEIVYGSDITEDSLVIEIGPGTGVLTCPMAEQAGRLIAMNGVDAIVMTATIGERSKEDRELI